MLKRILIFGLLNFGGLAIGSFYTGPGVASEWYQSLNQAPWTPPGWVFGAAWTTIMICYTIYLSKSWTKVKQKEALASVFGLSLILNIAWNPVFFGWQAVLFALLLISMLTLLIFYILFKYRTTMKSWSLLLAPYMIWLLIATSLNAYILLYNN